MAEKCLELILIICQKSLYQRIFQNNLGKNDFIVLIQADLLAFRKKYNNQLAKQTLTIPKWLNEAVIERKINFSKVLREALEKEIIL